MIDTLSTSTNPMKKFVDSLWLEKVQKRKQQIDSGEVTLVDGEEVFKKLALKLTSYKGAVATAPFYAFIF